MHSMIYRLSNFCYSHQNYKVYITQHPHPLLLPQNDIFLNIIQKFPKIIKISNQIQKPNPQKSET